MNTLSTPNAKSRIQLVDALRGFALLGIVLIHYVEHFDFFTRPATLFFFSAETDQMVMDTIMFMISGKAYSIFALMFGLSFFIQIDNKAQQGIDFRPRLAWRLLLLLVMGFIHSLIYRGDILHVYALLGMPLLLVYRLNSKLLLGLAILLAAEVPILYHLVHSFMDSSYEYVQDWGGNWFSEVEETYATGSLGDVIKTNIWKGRYLVWSWTYYSGRSVQLVALFVVGLLLGRKGVFKQLDLYKNQLRKILIASVVLIGLFHFLASSIESSTISDLQKYLFSTLIRSFSNLAYTSAIVCLFSLASLAFRHTSAFNALATYGKMSLTNYVSQAVLGVMFFYGFGFGLFKYLGATWSLLFGASFFFLQLKFSQYWIKYFYYGPLEWFWRALTFMDFKLKFKR